MDEKKPGFGAGATEDGRVALEGTLDDEAVWNWAFPAQFASRIAGDVLAAGVTAAQVAGYEYSPTAEGHIEWLEPPYIHVGQNNDTGQQALILAFGEARIGLRFGPGQLTALLRTLDTMAAQGAKH